MVCAEDEKTRTLVHCLLSVTHPLTRVLTHECCLSPSKERGLSETRPYQSCFSICDCQRSHVPLNFVRKKPLVAASDTEVLSAALVVSLDKIHKHVGAIIRISKKIASTCRGRVFESKNSVFLGLCAMSNERRKSPVSVRKQGFFVSKHESLHLVVELIPNTDFIDENLVRVIKHVAGEFVIHTDTIFKIF